MASEAVSGGGGQRAVSSIHAPLSLSHLHRVWLERITVNKAGFTSNTPIKQRQSAYSISSARPQHPTPPSRRNDSPQQDAEVDLAVLWWFSSSFLMPHCSAAANHASKTRKLAALLALSYWSQLFFFFLLASFNWRHRRVYMRRAVCATEWNWFYLLRLDASTINRRLLWFLTWVSAVLTPFCTTHGLNSSVSLKPSQSGPEILLLLLSLSFSWKRP